MNLAWPQRGKSVFGCVLVALLSLLAPLQAKEPKADAAKQLAVTFLPAGGVYRTNVLVKLSSAGDAPIRFTLDGSDPHAASPLYSAPLLVTNTMLVRAGVFPKAAPPSATVAAVYTLLDDELASFSSNIPLIIVNSFGTNIIHERKIEGAMQIADGGRDRTKLTGATDFSGRCLINLRGRASLRYPKSSFTVKWIDGEGDPAPASVFGMPADADWVLYAPYPDKTLIRDVVAYEMHAAMGHWAPRTRLVEVFVNPTGTKLSRQHYAGVYVFEERVKRGKDRVDIAKLKPDDDREPRITGGYIFKKDHIDTAGFAMGGEGTVSTYQNTRAGYPTGPGGFPADPQGFQPAAKVTRSNSSSSSSRRASRIITNHFGYAFTVSPEAAGGTAFRDDYETSIKEEESFKTTRTNEFFFVEPEPDEITAAQKSWLKVHLNQVEAALYGDDFRDPATGWRAFLDADSFIDYHLITEATKNVDGFRFSVFFSKDRGGKIKADPIWDWNLSFGNANGKQGWMPEYWLWPQLDNKECTWYRRLFDDPDFGQRYVDRWARLRTNVFATAKILARIDELTALLQESQQRNFEKWPILGRPINPNYFVGTSYEQEIGFLKTFIQTRLDWMEKQFPPVPALGEAAGGNLRLAAPTGEIYFTLDGTDPRATGGAVAAGARLFTTSLTRPAGAKVKARTKQDERWSGPLVSVP